MKSKIKHLALRTGPILLLLLLCTQTHAQVEEFLNAPPLSLPFPPGVKRMVNYNYLGALKEGKSRRRTDSYIVDYDSTGTPTQITNCWYHKHGRDSTCHRTVIAPHQYIPNRYLVMTERHPPTIPQARAEIAELTKDSSGRVIQYVDFLPNRIGSHDRREYAFQYDDRGLLKAVTLKSLKSDQRDVDPLTEAKDVYRFTYDEKGRMRTVEIPDEEMPRHYRMIYGQSDRVDTIRCQSPTSEYPNSFIVHDYDANGQLIFTRTYAIMRKTMILFTRHFQYEF